MRGFATVEVLVTFAIVVLIGAMAITVLGRSDTRMLQSDAARLALILQQARLQAAETGLGVQVIFDAADRALRTPLAIHTLAGGVTTTTPSTTVLIRPSGENEGLDLVLTAGNLRQIVTLDWLTGQVRIAP